MDNRLRFAHDFVKTYPPDKEGRSPPLKVVIKALAHFPLRDSERMLLATRNYAATESASKGMVFSVRRFVTDEWERYLQEAKPPKENGNGQNSPNNRYGSQQRLADSIAKEAQTLALEGHHLELLPGGKSNSAKRE